MSHRLSLRHISSRKRACKIKTEAGEVLVNLSEGPDVVVVEVDPAVWKVIPETSQFVIMFGLEEKKIYQKR